MGCNLKWGKSTYISLFLAQLLIEYFHWCIQSTHSEWFCLSSCNVMCEWQSCGCGLSSLGQTSFKKFPFEGEWSLFLSSQCHISHCQSRALSALLSTNSAPCQGGPALVPCFNQIASSFHDAKFLRWPELFSWLFKAVLAFIQSDSPLFVKSICSAEKSWQQKQKFSFWNMSPNPTFLHLLRSCWSSGCDNF